MHRPLVELEERLLRAGIARRHVKRYLTELTDHLADLCAEEESAGREANDAAIAALERLGPTEDLAQAMLAKSELGAWCARVPWVVFSAGPLILLYALYLTACLILWAGWRIFLPEYDSPFGAGAHGFANLYFQAGKYYYFAAPVLVGWWIEFIAARQRVRGLWLTISLLLVAWTGAAARIQASRARVHGGLGHIAMNFDYWSSLQHPRYGMPYAAAILVLATLPYVFWRIQRAHSSAS
jgi:hypothetical protein